MAKKQTIKLSTDLHEGQLEVLRLYDTPARFIALNTGRQYGKSVLLKHMGLEALFKEQSVMWVSKTIPSSRSHWRDLLRSVQDIPGVTINKQAKEIVYGFGVLRVRSAHDPDNLRGEALDLILLDEAAHYYQGEYVFWSVIVPMITAKGGKIVMATSPFGQNWFYEIYEMGKDKKEPDFESRTYTSFDNPYQDRRLLNKIREKMPSIQWRTEYMAEFVASVSGVFAGLEDARTVQPERGPAPGGEYVIGVDVGHTNDSTCVCVIDSNSGRQVAGYRYSEMGTIEPIRRIVEIMDKWKPKVTAVETNGLGQSFFGVLREVVSNDISDYAFGEVFGETKDYRAGRHRLRGVHMDAKIKEKMVNELSAAIEYSRLSLLSVDCEYGKVQSREMSTYERIMSQSSNNVKFGAPAGYHDDTVSALYLAYSCMPKRKNRPKLPSVEKGKKKNPFNTSRRKSLHARS